MNRFLFSAFSAFCATAVILLVAVSCGGGPPGTSTREVPGAGKFIEGWSARLDQPSASLEQVRFEEVEGCFEVSVGPNLILWHPADTAEGVYRLAGDVTHLNSHEHPHGAGIFFGGQDLEQSTQRYTYFLIRGDGRYLIKTRNGAETEEIAGWTENSAVVGENRKGVAPNSIAVEVGADETKFLANGKLLRAVPNGELHLAGHYGFRMVHDLDMRFGKLKLTRD